MKKPIALTFVFFCSVLALAIASALLYRNLVSRNHASRRLAESERDRARMEQTRQTEDKQRQETDQAAAMWRSARQIPMGSEELTNTVRSVAEKEAGQLEASETAKLVDAITCWLHATATGSYADFLAFRQPDSVRFETDESQMRLNSMSKEIPGLLDMTDDGKCAALFEHRKQPKVASLPENGLEIAIMSGTTEDDIDPGMEKGSKPRGHYLRHKFPPGLALYHIPSPYQYTITPSAVLQKSNAIEMALVSTRLITEEHKIVLLPHVTFFWSPSEKRWKPFEFTTSLAVPLPQAGISAPTFFF